MGNGAHATGDGRQDPTTAVALVAPAEPPALGRRPGWLTRTLDRAALALADVWARRQPPAQPDALELRRTGGVVARWLAYPSGVRAATAGTSALAAGLAGWGVLALGGGDVKLAVAATLGAALVGSAAGPLADGLASRLHRLIARQRLHRLAELRALPDRRTVAVRGVVLARRTAASALDGRSAVWSITRLRLRTAAPFFHEVAFDFLLDDGTDEPVWVEVAGGMLLERFGPDRRFRFGKTTLLELDHPVLTRLRLRDREVRGAEINVAAGDVVEVVGRLSTRVDPTAGAASGRSPPERRALRSGTRVPIMVRKVGDPDGALAHVRRQVPRDPPEVTPGEPPLPRF